MPVELKVLSEPLLLHGESIEDFKFTRNMIIEEVQPESFIEWLWTSDLVELSWEILRYRRAPSGAHHIKFADARAMGRRVSDKYTVPICGLHRRELHWRGNERTWWQSRGIDPLPVAGNLWESSHAVASATAGNERSVGLNGKHLTNGSAARHQNNETKPIVGLEGG
jgi:hypothetical protein